MFQHTASMSRRSSSVSEGDFTSIVTAEELVKINAFIKSKTAENSDKKLPLYVQQAGIKTALGDCALSLFGGADVTPLAAGVSKLVIIDANPFLDCKSIPTEAKYRPYAGVLHSEIGEAIVERAPQKYATMPNYSDYNSPYGYIDLIAYRAPEMFEEYKTSQLMAKILENYSSGKHQEIAPSDIGVSTALLYRIGRCLDAQVTGIERSKTGENVFRINIIKPTGEKASIYYVNCTMGQGKVPELEFLKRTMPTSIESVAVRGFPSEFFHTLHKGDQKKIQEQLYDVLTTCSKKDVDSLKVVCCSNPGDKFPVIFSPTAQEKGSYTIPHTEPYSDKEFITVHDNAIVKSKNVAIRISSKPDTSFLTWQGKADIKEQQKDFPRRMGT